MNTVKSIAVAMLAVLPVAGYADAVTNVTWDSSVSLGATIKTGNTDKRLYTMNVKADRFAPKSDLINSLYGEYGNTEHVQTEGQLRGQSNYRYKFGGKDWYGGAFVEVYHDAIKNINYRAKGGPNVGYYWINKEAMKLDTSIGVNYVHEDSADGKDDFAEYRAALNYLWNINDHASYYLNIEYTANVRDVDDGSGLLVTGAKSKINENLSLFVELRDEYDNQPAEDVEYNDSTLVAGLTYDF